jgi:uncharacterized protein
MGLAGLAFTLAGGCPGRQLVLSGEGDADAGVFVLGLLAGAALGHNWLLVATPDQIVNDVLVQGGPGLWGKIAVGVGLAYCAILGASSRALPKTT